MLRKSNRMTRGRDQIWIAEGLGRKLVALMLMLLSGTLTIGTQTVPPQDQPADAASAVFLPLQDTLYVLDSTFIEIRLDEQMLYQYFRNDSVYAYPVSTGNPKLPLGIATREGIFSMKGKARRHTSTRFHVPMLYWMPFDGGIGIHALEGSSYYWYLGSRTSSHGCVRISREAAREIFSTAPRGTTVIVHSGAPARILEFGDTARMPGLRVMRPIDAGLMAKRLLAVQAQQADDPILKEQLALPPRTTFTGRISVGKLKLSSEQRAAMKRITAPPIELPTQ